MTQPGMGSENGQFTSELAAFPDQANVPNDDLLHKALFDWATVHNNLPGDVNHAGLLDDNNPVDREIRLKFETTSGAISDRLKDLGFVDVYFADKYVRFSGNPDKRNYPDGHFTARD